MNWVLIGEGVYIVVLVITCLRIIYDTRSTTKTLAYLLFAIFAPFFGMAFYFTFGINYRRRKMYSKKLLEDRELALRLRQKLYENSLQVLHYADGIQSEKKELAHLLLNDSLSPVTDDNAVKLLTNGEQKFPEILEALQNAKHHIHIEYYIYEDDIIGQAIEEVLVQKAKEGVIVRFIYDDFGSRSIRRRLAKSLRANGVQVFPFMRIIFVPFANRLNYRNHRKIIVIDGKTGFVGGINISDRYINRPSDDEHKTYWRDTHLRIDGSAVKYLQYLFVCDWNFCAKERIQQSPELFPPEELSAMPSGKIVQMAASGPDSATPTILFSILKAIGLARKEILITTPYFIPGESLMDSLTMAALSGVLVKILVPYYGDSIFVNTAAKSYYEELLHAGVEIYRYKKGFVHAKTIAIDRELAIIGTANMDYRSFDLNFEVNAIVYDEQTAHALSNTFYDDLLHAHKIVPAQWFNRPKVKKMLEKTVRLVSPLL